MREYYRRPGVADKVRSRVKRYRDANIDKVREYDRERGFRGDPEKTKARNAARSLDRQPCWCGEPGEAHHPDYGKPLNVIWLCRKHHAEIHREVF